jgi:hypothetical protein
MAATDDRKRQYPIDSSESEIQAPRQPPKKRFLSSTPTSPTSSQAVEMDDEQQNAEDPNDPFKVLYYGRYTWFSNEACTNFWLAL